MTEKEYFLGGDIGSSKTHVLITDREGRVLGFGEGGAGNHETVGYAGLTEALSDACRQAYAAAGVCADQISGAGFGVSGYDWPFENAPTVAAIREAGITAPLAAVNDATLGILAGSAEGWGLAVVSGTGCNCRGWDRQHRREGKVTGHGVDMGEGAGGSELIFQAIQRVSHEWTRRGPATAISQAFIRLSGASGLEELVEGISVGRYQIGASAAPLVFQAAEQGDAVARELVRWAGCELGELARAVIRQLSFEALEFDVVMIGGMFKGGPMLIEAMRETIHGLAPGARLVPLTVPPVVGAVLLGMEQAGIAAPAQARQALVDSMYSLTGRFLG